ncbi:MoaD/ThiS family protein [Polynucleobacter necessarius]|nr:hypothetical protein [Polynucleobacter necessarius]
MREAFGTSQETINVPATVKTVAEVIMVVPTPDGAEVAFFPPVTGG